MTPTPSEAVALAWVSRHLHVLVCHCGGRWITAKSRTAIFHSCAKPKQRGLPPTWSRESYAAEERQAWAERQLGAGPIQSALEAELGEQALRGDD